MIWGKEHDVPLDLSPLWVAWFAWYPVRLWDGRWCWLEKIERLESFCFDECTWVFRIKET